MSNTKFRVWHKFENRFIDLNGFDTAFGKMSNAGEINAIYEQGKLKTYLIEDCIIEQFTGLKDKNGKEIYEGDIIKHNDNKYIVWDTDNFGLMFIKVETFSNDRVLRMSHRYRDYNWAYNVKKYIEIIGNIHEDKNLISH